MNWSVFSKETPRSLGINQRERVWKLPCFLFHIQVCGPIQVNFCLCCEVEAKIHFLLYKYWISQVLPVQTFYFPPDL